MHSAKGEWKGIWAGGCLNYGTWFFNPAFKLSVDKRIKATIVLTQLLSKADKTNSANIHPISFSIVKAKPDSTLPVIDSPDDFVFQHEFEPSIDLGALVDLDPSMGPLLVVPSTFYPKQQQQFEVSIFCNDIEDYNAVHFEPLPLFELKDASEEVVNTIFDADSVSESLEESNATTETPQETDNIPVSEPIVVDINVSEPSDQQDATPLIASTTPEESFVPSEEASQQPDEEKPKEEDAKEESTVPLAPPSSVPIPPPLQPQTQVAKPKPPSSSSSSSSSSVPPPPAPEIVKSTPPILSTRSESEEILSQIKNVQSRLKSVKNLPKPAVPRDTNPFFKCFNVDKILARRMYIADSDEEENEDDFDDDW